MLLRESSSILIAFDGISVVTLLRTREVRYFFVAAFDRSARASRRLNFASWITPGGSYQHDVQRSQRAILTSISITREVPSPLHKRAALILAARDRVAAHRRQHTRVRELRLRGDDAVRDVVVDGLPYRQHYDHLHSPRHCVCRLGIWCSTHTMLLLLHLHLLAILERPRDHIRLLIRALDELALLDRRPELGEVLQLDVVPDVGERGFDDGRFDDGGRGWDGHDCWFGFD